MVVYKNYVKLTRHTCTLTTLTSKPELSRAVSSTGSDSEKELSTSGDTAEEFKKTNTMIPNCQRQSYYFLR